jgi:hypothetical protein
VTRGGIRSGKGTHYFSNGDIYDGEFVRNKRIGKSRLLCANGSEYIGQFIDNEVDGHGIYSDKFGNRFMSMVAEEPQNKVNSQYKEHNETSTDARKLNKDSGYFYKLRLYGKGEFLFKVSVR